jgi:hypothetical protein
VPFRLFLLPVDPSMIDSCPSIDRFFNKHLAQLRGACVTLRISDPATFSTPKETIHRFTRQGS